MENLNPVQQQHLLDSAAAEQKAVSDFLTALPKDAQTGAALVGASASRGIISAALIGTPSPVVSQMLRFLADQVDRVQEASDLNERLTAVSTYASA